MDKMEGGKSINYAPLSQDPNSKYFAAQAQGAGGDDPNDES